jgi:hypothetical protein
VETPDIFPECIFQRLALLSIRATDLLNIFVHSILTWPTDMIDANTKLQDVIHLDTISDEIDSTFAGDRIAQEKKLVRKIDTRMMPMMMLICTCRPSDPGPDS